MNLWDFRSIVSIIEHEGITLIKFCPGISIDAVTRKILDLGYAREEFQLLPGGEPSLVDFRVFSDEEFPLYLCLSQIFNSFPFTAVTIEGDVFARDVAEIEASGGRFLGDIKMTFDHILNPEARTRIQQSMNDHGIFMNLNMKSDVLSLPAMESHKIRDIINLINGIVRIAHVHGTFVFDIDPS